MIIDCISDLHGHYPNLEGGDLLIVSGDLTATDSVLDHMRFQMWLHEQDYKKRIIIAGNHDNRLQQLPFESIKRQYAETGEDYLCDSGTEFEHAEPVRDIFDPDDKTLVYRKTIKIWGSPWTKTFPEMNRRCKAFTVDTERELNMKFCRIPDDTDILITHSPPYGMLDIVGDLDSMNDDNEKFAGSKALRQHFFRVKPKLHVFGHIHECGGSSLDLVGSIIVNASHVNANYEPVHGAVRVVL